MMEDLTTGIKEKFSGLLFFLKRSKKEFEMVADEIEDSSLKTALNGLSVESSYYAGEIKTYLKSMGISSAAAELTPEDIIGEYPELNAESAEKGDELRSICSQNEASLIRAYSEILNEAIPFKVLKEIMLYQLNALKYTFIKIKTLNSARFAAC